MIKCIVKTAISTRPVITVVKYRFNPKKFRPLEMTCKIKTAMIVPATFPEPPFISVPPKTQAATDCSKYDDPYDSFAEL